MNKKEVREIDVEVLKEFLDMYVPEAKIILYDDGIEIDHEGYTWLLGSNQE